MTHWLARPLAAALGSVAGLSLAAPAASDLSVTVTPLVSRPRTGGVVPVELLFRLNRIQLLEGRLEVDYMDEQALVGRYRTSEMALTAGDKKVRLLLPPVPPGYGDRIDMVCRFVVGDRQWVMPPQMLLTVPKHRRSFVLAVCSASHAASAAIRTLEPNLLIDRFDPDFVTDMADRSLTTGRARLAPEDMPSQPLAYCAYDVVALDLAGPDVTLRQRQQDALRRWVEAGGSVIVLASGRVSAGQLDFLNGLAGRRDRFGTDGDGSLTPPGVTLLRPELGRAVIVGKAGLAEGTGDSRDWRRAVTFLWKVRKLVADEIIRTGRWALPMPEMSQGYRRYGSERQAIASRARLSLSERYSSFCDDLLQALRPERVRLVPSPLVFGLFVVFVALIGPADWWVLGWLKRRRYTWILFPLVTAGITFAMVKLAERYLGRTDLERSVTVVDVGQDGRVLRRDCYTFTFSARERQTVVSVRDAFWSLVRVVNPREHYYDRRSGRWKETVQDNEAVTIEGRIPSRFEVTRHLRQWSPQLTRTLSMERLEQRLPEIRWEMAERYANNELAESQLPEKVLGDKTAVADVYVFRTNAVVRMHGSGSALSPNLAQEICAPRRHGLLRLVSQISPTGGAAPEDAVVLDADDKRWGQVAVALKLKDDVFLFRRCYEVR